MMRNSTLAFIAAVKRRLWLEDALQRLHYALGAVSGAMLVLAAVNAWWLSLPPPVLPIAMVLAATAVLLPLAWSLPSLEDGAARADRIFHGRSLMTTALEVHRVAAQDRSPAAHAVLKEAADRAAALRPNIARTWRAPAAGGFVLAAIPAFVALLLLESATRERDVAGNAAPSNFLTAGALGRNSGAYRDAGDAPGTGADNAVVDARPAGDFALADEAGPFKDVGNTSGGEANAAPGKNRPAGDTALPGEPAHAAGSYNRADDSPGEGTYSATAEARASGDAASLSELAPLAGNAPRVPAVHPTSAYVNEIRFSERADTAFERRGQAMATAEETRLPYAAAVPVAAHNAVLAAAAPPDGHGWSTLTAAEVAYARRYLDAANNDERD